MTRSEQPDKRRKFSGNGVRLLIILGIAILACISLRSAVSVVLYVATSMQTGTLLTGDFWSNEFPTMVLVAVVAAGSFGIYRLMQMLRK